METPRPSEEKKAKGGMWFRRGDELVHQSELTDEERAAQNADYLARKAEADRGGSTVEVDPALLKQERLLKALAEADQEVARAQGSLRSHTERPFYAPGVDPGERQASAAAWLRASFEKRSDLQVAADAMERGGGDHERAAALLDKETEDLNEAMRRKSAELSDARGYGDPAVMQKLDGEREALIARREAVGRAKKIIEEI